MTVTLGRAWPEIHPRHPQNEPSKPLRRLRGNCAHGAGWEADVASRTADGARNGQLMPGSDEQDAFASFYRRHGGQVLRALAVTFNDEELARDATQEAMARAWRSWGKVRAYTNPAGWVYRVGLNWGRSRIRRLRREVLGTYRDRTVAAPTPHDPALAQALKRLSERHRAVVVLRLYLDWSVEDVAAALRVLEGTVKSRLHTAMNQLRSALEANR